MEPNAARSPWRSQVRTTDGVGDGDPEFEGGVVRRPSKAPPRVEVAEALARLEEHLVTCDLANPRGAWSPCAGRTAVHSKGALEHSPSASSQRPRHSLLIVGHFSTRRCLRTSNDPAEQVSAWANFSTDVETALNSEANQGRENCFAVCSNIDVKDAIRVRSGPVPGIPVPPVLESLALLSRPTLKVYLHERPALTLSIDGVVPAGDKAGS